MKYINLDKYGKRTDPFYFALEKHLLNLTGDFSFIWDVFPAVIIGKHQVARNEINFRFLEEHKIKLFRRPSGGGAVYSDEGCVKYTFLSRDKSKEEMFEYYLNKIKDFLFTYYNLEVLFSGRNDLIINEAKFSGNAYYKTNQGSILHGTLLFDTDLGKLTNVLTPNKEKLSSKGVDSVKSRVINLSTLINISREQFIKDFKEFLNESEQHLKIEDEEKIFKYYEEFNSYNYIYGIEPKYEVTKSKRFTYGEVIVSYTSKNSKIVEVQIFGDFFEKEDIKLLQQKLIGLDPLQINKLNVSNYIDNMPDEDFINLLKG